MNKKSRKSDPFPPKHESAAVKSRTTFRQAIIIILVSLVLFFGLLEGGLILLGFKPVLTNEDPFVGFASNVPLFVPSRGPGGRSIMTTAPNKTTLFNKQEFAGEKPPNTYRIFCMGGSTTYGRPYDDTTSFAGWLRELLPLADGNKSWEVINAGGISYASYRVAHLMEELVNYQPDLFIIYTGHNEFLEERTYRKLRKIPPLIQSTVSLLAHTRTWSAMASALQRLGISPQTKKESRDTLAADVVAVLDRSIGPDDYTRNDPLRDNILEHYRISLKRMVSLAQSVGAQVIFVTPASNLKDFSPFKSEHTGGLDLATDQRMEQILAQAKEEIRRENWNKALDLLEKAVASDPRYAELQYRHGRVLLTLSRFNEAETALRLARDEDVCPLRALTVMRRIVSETAREYKVGLVDYIDLLEKRMQAAYGQPIPGEEFFLDHVHPTIQGHGILAVALIQTMADLGLVRLRDDWGEQLVDSTAAKIEGRIDQEAQGEALNKLARVLLWAGKAEDAARLARQALDTDTEGKFSQVAVEAASTLSTYYQRQGYLERARQQLYSAIEKAPGSVDLRLKLGSLLLKRPFLQLDEAAANLLWVCQQWPDKDAAYQLFGQAMAWRGRPRIAYDSLMRALRLNPKNKDAEQVLAQIRPFLDEQTSIPQPHAIQLDTYPSFAPRNLVQLGHDAGGRRFPDGIEVEFHENGRVKRLLDFDQGVRGGFEITWDAEGKVLSRIADRQGNPVDLEPELQALYSAIEDAPGSVDLRMKLGSLLLKRPFLQPDEAAANLLWVCQQMPDNDVAYQLFGEAMVARSRLKIAYSSLMKALRLNPKNKDAEQVLAQIRPFLEQQPSIPQPHKIQVDAYPSLAPRSLVQLVHIAGGSSFPDGIEVQFHENGRVKRLTDFEHGVQEGLEITWDRKGRIISCVVYLQGAPAGSEPGKSS